MTFEQELSKAATELLKESEGKRPVTGGADRWPVYDRYGIRIYTGDKLRAQICVGRYGQTRVIETTVTDEHWPYCMMSVVGGCINAEFDFAAKALRCSHRHRDFEHGHEVWAEIMQPTAAQVTSDRVPV